MGNKKMELTPKVHAQNLIYEYMGYFTDYGEDITHLIKKAIEYAILEVNNELKYMDWNQYDPSNNPYTEEHLDEVKQELTKFLNPFEFDTFKNKTF